jgi:hypothetical protein
MKTEIFIELELMELETTEASEEWANICLDLGLEGQTKLIEKSPELKPPPYRAIDPEKSTVESFSVSTIPLDIIREYKKCKDNGWYNELFIYYDNKSPDPFLIGKLTDGWNSPYHLIARWGDELLPFEELEIKAVNRLLNDAKVSLIEIKSKIDYYLQNPQDFVQMMLGKNELPKIDFDVKQIGGW